jgi:hypothetical protein
VCAYGRRLSYGPRGQDSIVAVPYPYLACEMDDPLQIRCAAARLAPV